MTGATQSHEQRREGLTWLYGFLWPERVAISGLLLLSMVTTALVVAQPWVTKLIIDDGLLAGDFEKLMLYALLGLSLGVLATLLSGVSRIAHTRLSGNILFALRENVFSHILQLRADFFAGQRVGDISSRMDRDVAEIQRFAVDTLFSSFSAVLGLLGAAGMMVFINWQLSVILLALIPLELAFLRVMRPRVERKNREFREKSADISAFFAEKLPAVKTIQSASAQKREATGLTRLNRTLLGSLLGLQKTEFVTSAVPAIMVSSARAAVFLIGGYWVIEGDLQVGSLIAFTAYVGMAVGPVQSLLGIYLAWQRLRVSLDRVNFLRQQPIPEAERSGGEVPVETPGTLEVRGLTFGFPGRDDLYSELSFSLAQGQKWVLIGDSGAGKSTLLDLLVGHLEPQAGKILLGGIDQGDSKPSSWRQRFGILPQEPVIFRGTLRDNLCYAATDVSDIELEETIAATGLQTLLDKLPSGLDSTLGERGSNLSGGERQRIALARALLQKPTVLILDEPISAADPGLGRQLIAEVDRLFADTTRIVVSHRAEAIFPGDRCHELIAGVLHPRTTAAP